MSIPRIRGKVGAIEDPKDLAGKFAFTISLWTFDGEKMIGDPFGPFGPYETEAIAKEEMRKVTKEICEEIERNETGKVSGMYLDLKNGAVLRSWSDN